MVNNNNKYNLLHQVGSLDICRFCCWHCIIYPGKYIFRKNYIIENEQKTKKKKIKKVREKGKRMENGEKTEVSHPILELPQITFF